MEQRYIDPLERSALVQFCDGEGRMSLPADWALTCRAAVIDAKKGRLGLLTNLYSALDTNLADAVKGLPGIIGNYA